MDTTVNLLAGVRDRQEEACRQFASIYQPMIVRFARRLGLNIFDAEDISQETITRFLEKFPWIRYDGRKGSFRRWLFVVARRVARTLQQRQARMVLVPGDAAVLWQCASRDEAVQAWDEEWQRAMLHAAMDRAAAEVSARTWAIFDLCVMQGWKPEAVAMQFDVTTNAVYLTRKRLLTRIRKTRQELEDVGSSGPVCAVM